jgi:hypothetical protein
MYTPSFQRKSGSEPIPNSSKLGRESGGMTFLGLRGTGAITFFSVSVAVTVAVVAVVATVIAITHNKELVALSRSALTD